MVDVLISLAQANPDAGNLPFPPSSLFPSWLAAAAAGCGLLLAVMLHRRHPATGWSLGTAGVTVAATLSAIWQQWPWAAVSGRPILTELASLSIVLGVLAAAWSLLAWRLRRFDARRRRCGRPPIAPILAAWALGCGLVAVAVNTYVMLGLTVPRLLDGGRPVQAIPLTVVWSIIFLLVAILFQALDGLRPRQPAAVLILTALLVWATSLLIPTATGVHRFVVTTLLPGQPIWWTWTLHLQLGLGLLLLIAALIQETQYRRRRAAAWPDRLDDLLAPYSRWPGFVQSEAVIAAAVLLLGVFQIVRPGPPAWPAAVGNFAASTMAGVTCMFMTYRRWSANTTGLAIALLTLASVALACAVPEFFHQRRATLPYAERLPVLYNAALFALAIMIAWWSWLARFWNQQLLDGVAWTTTGRMIPYAQRAAFLLTAVAVLAAFQMALWPRRVLPGVEDDSPARIAAGTAAVLVLALITARNARRLDSSANAAFSLSFLAAALLLLYIRLPSSAWKGWISQHDAVAYAGLALPILATAVILKETRWRCFAAPLWWLAVAILPAAALMEVRSPERPAADWIRPATFGLLTLVFLVAGSRRHRRSILVLAAVCLLESILSLHRAYF